ncbi:hypothetical protein RF11_09782 [Thelohanellus kitauei]|uniref:Transposon Ty3-I Gag-Pol polyprotein n=1 Tax=Thelohanellus kitauei TaxID=669202 RepID=A0A0C2N5Z7_THEKT|nr:hypothetical protein RF11_09782 [Thelohanellus kitauei]
MKEKLNGLVQKGIIQKIETSALVFSIVVVPKANGELRICTQFREGLNSQLNIKQCPIPTMKEVLLKLNDMNIFNKVNLGEAYFIRPLDEESTKVVFINNPFGIVQR